MLMNNKPFQASPVIQSVVANVPAPIEKVQSLTQLQKQNPDLIIKRHPESVSAAQTQPPTQKRRPGCYFE